MTGGVGERSFLSPARHTGVDEARIALRDHVGSESHAFHDAGAETLDEDVGAAQEIEHFRDVGRVLQVGLDDAAAALDLVGCVRVLRNLPCALHDDDVGAHVRQQCRGVRARSQSSEFHDPNARERALLLHSFCRHTHSQFRR